MFILSVEFPAPAPGKVPRKLLPKFILSKQGKEGYGQRPGEKGYRGQRDS
jgi:hypothetical protein